MSLVLNIYTSKDSDTTPAGLLDKLAQLPLFAPMEQGDLMYENPDTGVHFTVSHEPVEKPSLKYNSLELAFIINYIRPDFFGLEIFPLVADICLSENLILNIEQQGSPQAYKGDSLEREWRQTNDAALKRFAKDPEKAREFAFCQRKLSNERWKFMHHKAKLEAALAEKGEDYYVASLNYFRSNHDGKLLTAAAWPDAISIILPPYTDFVFLMAQKKGLFRKGYDFKGYVAVKRLVEVFPTLFVKQPDGSLKSVSGVALENRSAILSMESDTEVNQNTMIPTQPANILDVLQLS